MSYYWFNKQELLQKTKENYGNGGKERASEYYHANKDVIKQKANEKKERRKRRRKKSRKGV